MKELYNNDNHDKARSGTVISENFFSQLNQITFSRIYYIEAEMKYNQKQIQDIKTMSIV